jgi:hypothetical protein
MLNFVHRGDRGRGLRHIADMHNHLFRPGPNRAIEDGGGGGDAVKKAVK